MVQNGVLGTAKTENQKNNYNNKSILKLPFSFAIHKSHK